MGSIRSLIFAPSLKPMHSLIDRSPQQSSFFTYFQRRRNDGFLVARKLEAALGRWGRCRRADEKVYRHFVESDYARQQYRQFFDHVIDNAEGEGATLFHCTAGKDRTGFGAFLLLHVLAVAPATIKEDYLATNRYLAPMLKEKFAPMTQHLPQELLTAITVLMSAKESFLEESLAAIDQHFGSVDQYLLQGLGVTKEEQAYLTAQLTE